MPYKLVKSGKGWKVKGPSGVKSKRPLTRAKAKAQMKAIYANEKKGKKK